jgi:anti-sigma factor RsiW
MTDIWTDRLSEYLDDELPPSERAALDAHLPTCRECAETLDELRGVIAHASTVPARPPDTDLWSGIEPRLTRMPVVTPLLTHARRRISFTMPQALAAGLALMLMSGGGVWVLNHTGRAPEIAISAAPEADVVPVSATAGDPHYDEAISDLQQTLQEGRAQLDQETIRVLEQNLATIDKAIEQSRTALASDPANVYLHNHLAETRQRKLALLRRAAALVNKG